jgi:pimeloyl-ACP methyl ester carboxylesterase
MYFNRLFRGVCLLLALQLLGSAAANLAMAAGGSEVISLVTQDGVQLRLTYYPSPLRKGSPEAKQATPVVLLHDHKETRTVYNQLALKLQAAGEASPKGPAFAVISVDLRAHGESTKQATPDGNIFDRDAAKLTKRDYFAMAAADMEAVRSFIVERNDAGELNLNKLCIIGAGMGANVGANWALQDWTAPPLAIGKQGQDVKALVLISPRWSFNGLSFNAPMKFRPLKQSVAWMLIYGAQNKEVKADVERIYKQLERAHPKSNQTAGRGTGTLQVLAVPSKLQGSTLLTRSAEALDAKIIDFLVANVAKTPHPWTNRLARIPQP